MRKFNPDKELRKIQKGNKNKVIVGVIALLLIISIGSTYALYQVRYSKRIIYTKISPSSGKDINILAIYLDDEPTDKFPEKGSKVAFDKVECDNGSTGAFNTSTWKLILEAGGKDKCSVYFKTTTNYTDGSGANLPELYQGLIPVTLSDGGKINVANLANDWYDYDDHRWANAVLVNYSNAETKAKYFTDDGTLRTDIYDQEVPLADVLQMYVWIPRYKYQLFNVGNTGIAPKEIQIEFEPNTMSSGDTTCTIASNGAESCTNAESGKWYTHPAFKFGNTDLTGIWVGKFEASGNNTNVKIIPAVAPILNVNVSYMFNASRNIEETYATNFNLNRDEIDTHMMKNMEWGAMAYLTHSKYGRCTDSVCTEVTRNAKEYATGYDDKGNLWYTTNGQLASTTGNMYGIYDTNGDAWEYVMGNMVNASGAYYASSSALASVEEKYYDKYEYDASSYLTHARGHLGDATRETLQTFGAETGGWYGDYAGFPDATYSWFGRGGRAGDTTHAGTFAFSRSAGGASSHCSFRVVLSRADQ